jgi:hypothetical protein
MYFDHESEHCPGCGYFTYETKQCVPKVHCEICGREVLDITSSLERLAIPPDLLALIPKSLAVDCRVVPFSEGLSWLVVAADLRTSINTGNIETIRFVLNRPITCLHANEEDIFKAIERDYQNGL